MSRIKTIVILVLCLCLLPATVLAESVNLISDDLIKAETVNYETVTAELGVYEKTVAAQAAEYYPHTYDLRFEGDSAKFVEYTVSRGAKVKAGDVLAVVALESDGVSLASQQLSLERMEAEFEKQKISRQEEIDEMLENRASIQDPYERELASLRIQRAQLALEQYIYQQELAIGDLREDIAELEEEMSENVLVAPVDGEITELVHKRAGDRVYANEVLVTMYSTDVMLFRIKNEYGDFRYGMDVDIAVGPVQNRTMLTGKVVGADTLLPEAERRGYAFIAIDPYDEENVKLNIPSVSTKTQYLENILLIPKRAATLDGGKYYVTKLTDGAVQKRFVNSVMANNTHMWVAQGLEVGETIIID